MTTNDILTYEVATKSDLVRLLNLTGDEMKTFLKNAGMIKTQTIGNMVHFRGLIEFSNRCSKNCF